MGETIETSGMHLLERVEGQSRMMLNQRVSTRIEATAARVSVTSAISGRHKGVDLVEPGEIAALRKIDAAQYAASIADRAPVAEPVRVPFED
jgi:hypothetical protein